MDVRWRKPGVGFVKCNSDIAISEDGSRVGIGILIRNSQGVLVTGQWQTIHGFMSTKEAECMGLLKAI